MSSQEQAARLPTPIVSAVIEGAFTNNVKVIGPRGGRSRGRKPPARKPAARTPKAAPAARTAWPRKGSAGRKPPKIGADYVVQWCISLPPEMKAAIFAMAARCQTTPTAYARQALLHFNEWVRPKKPDEDERPISKAQLDAAIADLEIRLRAEIGGGPCSR